MAKRIVFLSLLLVCFIAQAAVTSSIDKKELSINDTLTLTIYADNISKNAVPDLTSLLNDFNLLSSAQTQQVQMINHRMTTETVWTFTLTPKHNGQIIIPAVTIGTQQTLPITIKVTGIVSQQTQMKANKLQSNNITQPASVLVEAKINPLSPYIQSEAIYTISLFYNKQIASPQLSDPQSADVNFLRIGQEQPSQEQINNQWYQVIRVNYAIFPQKSGLITIKGPNFNGDAILMNTAGFVTGSTPIHVKANDITINVKPVPAILKGKWWLPVHDVQLSEQWSGDIANLQVGVPISRTVKIVTQGTLATNLPSVFKMNIPDFEIYPDKPSLTNSSDGRHVFAVRVETAAYIPTKAGKLTLPAIEVNWWDTETETLKTATLPQKVFMVQPAANNNNVNENNLSTGQISTKFFTDRTFWIAGIMLISTGLVAAFLYRRKFMTKRITQPALTIYQAKKKVEEALDKKSLSEFIAALIVLSQKVWPEYTILSLKDIQEHIESHEAKQILKHLDALRYSANQYNFQVETAWKILWPAMQAKNKPAKNKILKTPSLYL